jgi:DNA-binding Lrp family transcriptional regulator
MLKNCPSWKETDVKLLYLTQRSHENEISVILDIKNTDALGDFITRHLSTLDNIKGVRIFNLIRPRFFPIPKDTSMDYKRFAIAIKADPKEYANIYHSIMELEPEENAIVTYIAYTFEAISQDILVSIIARDFNAVNNFVKNRIEVIKGVRDTTIEHITKTKRLIAHDKWEKYIEPYKAPICYVDKEFEKAIDFLPWEFTDKFVGC